MTFAAAVTALALVASPALAQTVYCTTSSQGYRVCDDGHGHHSTEWERDGMQFGEDSNGNRWTTSRWQGFETTTVERPDR
jgi:hypothetical protein